MAARNKLKIINDPVYGFINIPGEFLFDLIEHRYFQRLRRISQMGLSYLVYPGANHTRFHHAIGCMHLMQQTVKNLRYKGIEISHEEEEALYATILLHDIGHGPFSHTLEHSLIKNISHEEISLAFMEKLNTIFEGKLDITIQIFKGEYPRKFMNQLISSQLDMDRSDYLKRDSFYTGVAEGNINSERIIAMLNVRNDELIVEQKGIYSIEQFLIARRLMYWQVYLHKTSLAAEQILIKVLERARELYQKGKSLKMSAALEYFIGKVISKKDFSDEVLDKFALLDDFDIIYALKEWQFEDDFILSKLCKMILERDLPKIKITKNPPSKDKILKYIESVKTAYNIDDKLANYFVFNGEIKHTAYDINKENIMILQKNGKLTEVTQASDQLNLEALSKPVIKYYICYPKDLN